KPLLDVSRAEIKADLVQSGTGFTQAYKGSGVIVGVVDSGIDEVHSDFKTSAGLSRIRYLWDMSGSGNAPSGYGYGREYTKAQIDAGQCSQIDDNGHGTHVAGTAAGNGRAKTGYIGIAPEADIVFVKGFRAGSQGFQDNDVINGCSYIFQKAQALGKPAVINLSLGGHFGPHDGTSLYEQALSNLTGQGKIIVAAAGNEGSNLIHLTYSTSGSSYANAPETVLNITSGATVVYIDMWYPSSRNISVGMAGYNKSTGAGLFATPSVSPGNTLQNYSTGYGTVSIDASQTSNTNGAKRVFVILQGASLSGITWTFYTFGSGALDAWVAVGGGFTTNSGGLVRPGDNDKSIGMPATSQKVICVGSYTTKKQWVAADGNPYGVQSLVIGDISYFSSRGPTRDGRIKPDITAPGQYIGAALSTDAAVTHIPANQRLQGGKMAVMQGTSMAAPHVTGTLALLLGYYPGLDYATALNILKTTTKKDAYTGNTQNNTWGSGKLNANAAMHALITSDVENPDDPKPSEFALAQNYPNPFNPVTTISYAIPTGSFVKLKVYDLLGREVSTLVNDRRPAGRYDVSFDAKSLSSGIYFYRLTAGSFAESKKMLLVK
ncbi:MAG: S8 family serine peptidase, partial [Chlorobiales bacterium]|nr:S8 family serine peptidase [Chlorobiales bacterium]